MLGLALEGGGAKGSYEIGAYVALKKLGYRFDAVAGTSIGSLNAALIVQGKLRLAKRLWLNADSEIVGINKDIVSLSKNFKISKDNIKLTFNEFTHLIKNKGLDTEKYIDIIDKNVNERRVRKSKINYGLVTVRLNKFKTMELTIDDIDYGELSEYIMASSYLPIFKMNKIIDDSYYFDGGIYNNLPISLLEKMGCDEIIAIKINGIGRTKKKTGKNTKVIEISPSKDTGSIIFFDNNDIVNNYYMGYYDTLSYFKKIDGFKYYFKRYYYYDELIKDVSGITLNMIRLKYKELNIRDIIIKSMEDILEYNKVNYYKIYSIPKTLKMIKRKKLKCKSKVVNDFVYSLKIIY